MEFLKRLYQGDLPFSERTMSIVRDMMIVESTDDYQLIGKTGTGRMESHYIGWFVGYQEMAGNVYFIALNITGSSPEAKGSRAREIAQQILQSQTCSAC